MLFRGTRCLSLVSCLKTKLSWMLQSLQDINKYRQQASTLVKITEVQFLFLESRLLLVLFSFSPSRQELECCNHSNCGLTTEVRKEPLQETEVQKRMHTHSQAYQSRQAQRIKQRPKRSFANPLLGCLLCHKEASEAQGMTGPGVLGCLIKMHFYRTKKC